MKVNFTKKIPENPKPNKKKSFVLFLPDQSFVSRPFYLVVLEGWALLSTWSFSQTGEEELAFFPACPGASCDRYSVLSRMTNGRENIFIPSYYIYVVGKKQELILGTLLSVQMLYYATDLSLLKRIAC